MYYYCEVFSVSVPDLVRFQVQKRKDQDLDMGKVVSPQQFFLQTISRIWACLLCEAPTIGARISCTVCAMEGEFTDLYTLQFQYNSGILRVRLREEKSVCSHSNYQKIKIMVSIWHEIKQRQANIYKVAWQYDQMYGTIHMILFFFDTAIHMIQHDSKRPKGNQEKSARFFLKEEKDKRGQDFCQE